jgi:hypothetical protein
MAIKIYKMICGYIKKAMQKISVNQKKLIFTPFSKKLYEKDVTIKWFFDLS